MHFISHMECKKSREYSFQLMEFILKICIYKMQLLWASKRQRNELHLCLISFIRLLLFDINKESRKNFIQLKNDYFSLSLNSSRNRHKAISVQRERKRDSLCHIHYGIHEFSFSSSFPIFFIFIIIILASQSVGLVEVNQGKI